MKLSRPKIGSCSIRSGVVKFLWDETDPEDITLESFAVVPEFTVQSSVVAVDFSRMALSR